MRWKFSVNTESQLSLCGQQYDEAAYADVYVDDVGEQSVRDVFICPVSCNHSGTKLPAAGGPDEFLNPALEEAEVQAEDDQHDTQSDPHGSSFNLIRQADGYGGEYNE